ncbi:MAG: FKBP-type peptidyl-prolyl cis-trans isomerase [Muribaculaceae bacterium]|nr:FKBP-type peptidyl-prolyl cis-trans isomerase [Muribaculaceae bacterium]MBR6489350.1 FKBP-type peptidyl-prolyl cis-trans isomerase [Muribaculaceae bacterium]
METISKGKLVEIAYQIFIVDKDGDTLIYEFKADKPDRFVFGHEPGMLEAFTNHLEGLKAGDEFDFILSPIEAFGERNPEMETTLDKSLFVIDGEFDSERVYEGAFVPMMTADGMRIEGIVKQIADDTVTIDFNHQLAGETVKYTGKVINVREATEEEKNPPRHCGGCKDGGGCQDGCKDGNCGEGCNSNGCDGCNN